MIFFIIVFFIVFQEWSFKRFFRFSNYW